MPPRAAALRRWEEEGYTNGNTSSWSGDHYAYASKAEAGRGAARQHDHAAAGRQSRGSGETRGPGSGSKVRGIVLLTSAMIQRFERRFTLFTLPTRRYLRRRAWRYFRTLGKTDPVRYVTAAVAS